MPNLNKVILVGNLTRDPELKHLPSGAVLSQFGLAINRRWKGKDGQQKDEVAFIECTAWGRLAEIIAQYLAKGRPALVEGHLTQDRWEDKATGKKMSRLFVTVENVQFLGSRNEGSRDSEPGAEARYGNGNANTNANANAPSAPPPAGESYDDPELPF